MLKGTRMQKIEVKIQKKKFGFSLIFMTTLSHCTVKPSLSSQLLLWLDKTTGRINTNKALTSFLYFPLQPIYFTLSWHPIQTFPSIPSIVIPVYQFLALSSEEAARHPDLVRPQVGSGWWSSPSSQRKAHLHKDHSLLKPLRRTLSDLTSWAGEPVCVCVLVDIRSKQVSPASQGGRLAGTGEPLAVCTPRVAGRHY